MIRRLSLVYSAELEGVEAKLITIETDLSVGLSVFSIVGLADKALSEAKERINAALKNSGFKPPSQNNFRLTVNLAPADVQKTGSQYDLGIAIGYLLSSNEIKPMDVSRKIFLGELSLDGSLRPIKGALNIAFMAHKSGFKDIILPKENALEASLIKDINIIPVDNLGEVISYLLENKIASPKINYTKEEDPKSENNFEDIKGQMLAKRALLIAATGRHNVIMIGPPGSGKTALAKCFASILSPLNLEEIISTSKNWSAAGMLHKDLPLIDKRPFRDPHHTASTSAIIGGGTNPRPGEISLAHNGVLFLDELPEFNKNVLESLRTPLENGVATIARSKNTLTFPAQFQLIAAMNPCPCGYYNDPEIKCKCQARDIFKYQKKISGPLLDRIDLQFIVPRLNIAIVSDDIEVETSESLKKKALQGQLFAKKRYEEMNLKINFNNELSSKDCNALLNKSVEAKNFIKQLLATTPISGRSFYRLIKVARTIADLEESQNIEKHHLGEAFQYRLKTND